MSVVWEPAADRPLDAAALEAEIERVVPGAQVKLTWKDGIFWVRALAAAAMCGRGAEFAERDVSAAVVEVLADHDHPARVYSRASAGG